MRRLRRSLQAGARTTLDPYVGSWADEYLYRRLFNATHEQFLDESTGTVRWLLNVHAAYVAERIDPVAGVRREKDQSGGHHGG